MFIGKSISDKRRHGLASGSLVRHGKGDHQVESPPNSRIEKGRVIRCCNQKRRWRPVVNLKQNRDKAFELTDLCRVVASLGEGVKLVYQEDTIRALGVVENVADVVSGATEKAAHYCREIEGEQGEGKLSGYPPGSKRFPHTWVSSENHGAGGIEAFSLEVVNPFALQDELFKLRRNSFAEDRLIR